MNDLTLLSSITMTSLEISELVESRHDKVKQSIERLAERGVIELPPTGEIPTATKPTKVYIFTAETKRDSYIVVAQLSPEFTARLVDRWQALESGEATPAVRAPSQRNTPMPRAREVKEAFNCFLAIAKMCKFDGNQAILSANRATVNFTGVDPLAVMESTALIAKDQEALLLVTEIEKRLGWKARTVNPRLVECGMQVARKDAKGKTHYELTEQGATFGVYLDTGKQHGGGAPVQQVKWKASVVDLLGETYPAEGGAA